MSTVTSITPHTPSWFDLASPDIEASKRFYGTLFGWEAQQVTGPEAGNYSFFTLGGKAVGGMGSLMNEGQPPAWTTYLATENVDRTVEAVTAAGGVVAMPPMDVMESGRMAIFRDPTGAYLGLWQAQAHKGIDVMGEPNTYCWFELQTHDLPAAKRFYAAAFGWGEETTPMGAGQPDYTQWMLSGRPIGGATTMPDMIPAQVPPHWLVYFQVADVDAAAATIVAQGGRVTLGPLPFPGGHFAFATDPHGAPFGVMAPMTPA